MSEKIQEDCGAVVSFGAAGAELIKRPEYLLRILFFHIGYPITMLKNVLLFVAYFLADSHVCKQNSDFRGTIRFNLVSCLPTKGGRTRASYKSKHFMTSHQLYQESERLGTRYHNSLRWRNLQCFQKLPSLTLSSPALFTLFVASILLILLSNSDHLILLKAQWVTGIWDRT